ncbi:MAG: nitrilase-related carbon-nitrogen hydrolase, partial [Rubripirellula sp.]
MNPSIEATPSESRWHVSRQAWLLYLTAVFIGSIATTIPLAVWVSPIAMLLFLDRMPRLIGFLLFFVLVVPLFVITQKGVIPVPETEFYAMAVIIGVLGYVPYWIQIASRARLPHLLVPLVFPCATVAIEYAASTGAFGSWGSLAYSQAGNLTLMQLASITGIWGITFFMCWTASTAWWWLSTPRPSERRVPVSTEVIVYVTFAIAIIAFGQHRVTRGKAMLSQPNDGRQVACIVAPKGTYTPELVMRWLGAAREEASHQTGVNSERTTSLLAACRPAVFAELDYLLRKSTERANAGAKLIVWSEAALSTPPEFEAEVLKRCCGFAETHATNLAITLGVLHADRDPAKFIENKIVLINDAGSILGDYQKTNTVPGEPSLNGSGVIPSFETALSGN